MHVLCIAYVRCVALEDVYEYDEICSFVLMRVSEDTAMNSVLI